jgi:hypothetical protein
MKRGGLIGCIMQAIFLLSGCAAHNGTPFQYKVLYSSAQCKMTGSGPDVQLIQDSSQWFAFFTRHLRGGQLPPPKVPDIDFSDAAVLIVYAGLKPSAGYRIFADEKKIRIEDGVLRIVIDIQTPQPGQMQAQMLTAPCLVLSVPSGGYREIEIVDTFGKQLVEKRVN